MVYPTHGFPHYPTLALVPMALRPVVTAVVNSTDRTDCLFSLRALDDSFTSKLPIWVAHQTCSISKLPEEPGPERDRDLDVLDRHEPERHADPRPTASAQILAEDARRLHHGSGRMVETPTGQQPGARGQGKIEPSRRWRPRCRRSPPCTAGILGLPARVDLEPASRTTPAQGSSQLPCSCSGRSLDDEAKRIRRVQMPP